MPGRYNNYSLVIGNSNFNPYQSLQEMLVPFTAYKDAYEKQEAAMEDIANRDIFKVLADLPEGSKSRAIYEGYINDFNSQSDNFSKNGLTMQNRRALHNLKKRYGQEIGRLEAANTALQEERKLRRANKDTSMLYAEDNLNIDQFLDGNNPNLYSVSGEDLRREAAQYAQAASSRIYGNTRIQDINKYFQDIIQTQGYSPETLAAWRQKLESIPEFNQAVEDIMKARGVNGNLTGVNYERARQNIINGIMEGSVYQEKRTPHQNPGVLTATQAADNARANRSLLLNATAANMKWNRKTGSWEFDEDMAKKKQEYALSNPANPDSPQYDPDHWELKPDGKGGYSYVRKPQPKEEKENIVLNDAAAYDEDGNKYQVSTKDGKNLGKPLSYEEVAADPAFNQIALTAHPGYGDCYDYSISTLKGKRMLHITPNKRKLAEKLNKGKATPSPATPTGDPSKNNKLK